MTRRATRIRKLSRAPIAGQSARQVLKRKAPPVKRIHPQQNYGQQVRMSGKDVSTPNKIQRS